MIERKPRSKRLSRRSVIRTGLEAAGLAVLGAPWIARFAIAQGGGFDWKRYKGEHLEVSLTKGPRGDILQKYRKEFEDLTGMSVGDEQIPEQQHRQKVLIEFNSGNTSFDVVTMALHVQKRLYGKGKWLVDLRDLIKDPSMTSADFDLPDFSQGAMDYATQADGRLDVLPLNLDYFLIYWNKELFAAKGLAYPKSFPELLAAAKALNDPKAGVAGFLARGLKNANVVVWTDFLLGWGVDPIDRDLTMHTDGAEAIEAAKLYQALTKDYGPPGVAGFNWNECQSSFVLGRGAMWVDGIGFALPLEDKTKSRVVGKVGYGVMPPGPKAQHSALFGDGIGISGTTKKKGPAWLYCQWATSKSIAERQIEGGYGAPGRTSAYAAAGASGKLTAPREWLECMEGSIKIARPGLPEIFEVTQFRDIFGIALTNLVTGGDPASELKKATEQFKPILEKSEKG